MNKFPSNNAISWAEVKRPIVCLAPMDGITNSAYRQIVRSLNREVFLFSEFTSVDGLFQNKFLSSSMYYNSCEHPLLPNCATRWETLNEMNQTSMLDLPDSNASLVNKQS